MDSTTNSLVNLGNAVGGAVGEGIITGVDGYNTYNDIRGGDYTQAIHDGAQTIINGIETIKDGESGVWIDPK